MKTIRSLLALVMALCLALGASCALADQTLEGDANVDQRYYPAVTPFIHPPFYNVKLAVEVDDRGVITNVTDNGTGILTAYCMGRQTHRSEIFWVMQCCFPSYSFTQVPSVMPHSLNASTRIE